MRQRYTAKNKLNQANFNGSIIISGLVGLSSESFVVFFIALAICLGMSYHTGAIRS
jgi:hypothetical protein